MLLLEIIAKFGKCDVGVGHSFMVFKKKKPLLKNSIRKKTGAQNIVKEMKQCQIKWLQHVQRMDTNRIPKQALQYKPKGRRNRGRLRKRWKDQVHFEDQRIKNTPNPSRT
jgi:hypothetical protein